MELRLCALVVTIFSICVKQIGGNSVTLTPGPVATVTEGNDLKLQCDYNGSFTLLTVNWYLNGDTSGLVLVASDCSYQLIPSMYEIGRYNKTCSSPSFSLLIRNVKTDDDNDIWECDTTPISSVPPTKALTTIKVNKQTTSSSSTSSTTIKETVTSTSSPSTSTSSTTVKAATNSTSATGSTATASINTSTSTNHTAGSTASASSNTSTNTIDTKVIVLAVVVPIGGLLLIGVIIFLVVLCIRRHKAGKNGREIPDGMAAQDIGNNVDGWEQSLGHDRTPKQLNATQTTSDGFIIYPDPAAMSTARPNKEKKYLDVAYQYQTPYTGTYGYQAAYGPSTYRYTRSSTHKDKKHHNAGHPYSRPYTGTYDNQTAYGPSTYMSAGTYPLEKNQNYDYESPYRIAASRPVYNQTAYYPQTGYFGKISQDVYYKGGGHDSYGHRSRPHHDRSGRKQQREYYNQ